MTETEAAAAVAAPEPVLPWHAGLWQQIEGTARSGRLGHALLLCGNAGVGKRVFAERLARALLCRTAPGAGRPSFDACGGCSACHYFEAGTHPGYRRLALDTTDAKSSIPVDAVRDGCTFLSMTSTNGSAKVLVIDRADDLNGSGLNAVLKTLEEPPANTHLILTSETPAQLPATIRSRCQIVRIAAPTSIAVATYLASRFSTLDAAQRGAASRYAAGSPLGAARLLETPEAFDKHRAWSAQLDELRAGTLAASTFANSISRDDADAFIRFLTVTAWHEARGQTVDGRETAWQAVMNEALAAAAKLAANGHVPLVLDSLLIATSAVLRQKRKA
ncbi:MAG: DNA polymerase III subunit [Nevskiaceae bacterium]|nr:MAG: DNA polymerase III subunit [Nevskiaceae bacterium]TBR74771.1 MAG: DNA polymerase III subunit [Nevskiaceae bacterium]